MRVLFISSWYPNSVNPLKGIYVRKHAKAVSAAGAEVVMLALSINPSTKLFEKKISKTSDNGFAEHCIEINSKLYKFFHLMLFWQYRLMKRYYMKQIRPGFQPDIIHSSVLYPAAIAGDMLARKEKKPHVITEHWSKVDKFMSQSLYANLGKKAYWDASAITVVSAFLEKTIRKYVGRDTRLTVIPNVVNASVFRYAPKQKNDNVLVFSCVAHWAVPKRPDLIFEAMDYVSKQVNKKFVLNIVGQGPLMEALKKRTWNFEVNYKGNLASLQLADLLHQTDYFLHASDMETFSIVIAEALCTGTPVLSSNTGAITELVNSENGISTFNTSGDWANGLLNILEKKFDHEEISRQAQRFSEEEVGKRFLDLYNKLIP